MRLYLCLPLASSWFLRSEAPGFEANEGRTTASTHVRRAPAEGPWRVGHIAPSDEHASGHAETEVVEKWAGQWTLSECALGRRSNNHPPKPSNAPVDAAVVVAGEVAHRHAVQLGVADVGAHRVDQGAP